ncbi:SRPBCC family protein [Aestuariibius insulae]|uniref:SRPBCC family protein n=1 Tax=Aestuariibius insulae TaxID=2058287 RepID=UPI00345EA56A
MKIDVSTTVNAPAEKVWTLLGPRFGHISEWCATVNSSRLSERPVALQNAPAAGRHCETTFGPFDEMFRDYDPEARTMAYEATSPKLPFFIKRLTNRFTVESLGNDRCRVTMNSGADMTQPFRTLMGPMMKMSMGKSLRGLVEELKYYAENDVPHPRKVKAQAKTTRKAAA